MAIKPILTAILQSLMDHLHPQAFEDYVSFLNFAFRFMANNIDNTREVFHRCLSDSCCEMRLDIIDKFITFVTANYTDKTKFSNAFSELVAVNRNPKHNWNVEKLFNDEEPRESPQDIKVINQKRMDHYMLEEM